MPCKRAEGLDLGKTSYSGLKLNLQNASARIGPQNCLVIEGEAIGDGHQGLRVLRELVGLTGCFFCIGSVGLGEFIHVAHCFGDLVDSPGLITVGLSDFIDNGRDLLD